MEEVVCICICVFTLILIKIVFGISFKSAKELEQNNKLEEITNRFPDNIEVAKDLLKIINNDKVKVEERKNSKSSFYFVITDKIIIADSKNNYGRIQTVAHECLHSIQNKKLLIFNFVFSNILIIYYIISIILSVCNVFTNNILQAFILILMFLIQYCVRAFLEQDAMTKSKWLANKYIESKKLCTDEEKKELIEQYDKINTIGIPFYLFYLLFSLLIKIILFLLIGTFFN